MKANEINIPNEIKEIANDLQAFNAKKFFNDQGKFKHYEFATFLFEQNNGACIDGLPHIYDGKKYKVLSRKDFDVLLLEYIPTLTDNQNKEVFIKYEALCRKNVQSIAKPCYIGVNNGILDINKMELMEFTPNIYLTNIINADYKEGIKSDQIEKFISDISNDDQEIIQLMYEMIGYSMYRDNFIQKAFFFHSPGGNGKSTLFKLLHEFYGHDNTSALSFKDIQSRFKPASLQRILVNIADDIDPDYLKETGNYKTIVTGDRLNVERKGKDDFNFSPYVKLMFASNELPQTTDRTNGFYRRMVIVPMYRQFGGLNQPKDSMMIHKLISSENLSALLNYSLKALKELLDRGAIIEPKETIKQKELYKLENNPILLFINEVEDEDFRSIPAFLGRPVKKAYENYNNWCIRNGYKPVNSNNFGKEVKKLGYESVQKWDKETKKNIRFYCNSNIDHKFYDFKGNIID